MIANPTTIAATVGGIFVVANGLVVATVTLIGVKLTQDAQARRDKKADERALRDKRCERLRTLYLHLLGVVEISVGIANEYMRYAESHHGEVDYIPNNQLDQEAGALQKDLQDIFRRMRLETGIDTVITQYQSFDNLWESTMEALTSILTAQDRPTMVDLEEAKQRLRLLYKEMMTLRKALQTDLARQASPL